MEADTLDVVGGIRHGNRPTQVDHGLGLKRADVVATDPLLTDAGAHILGVPSGNIRKGEAEEDEESSNEAEALDDGVLITVLDKLSVVSI